MIVKPIKTKVVLPSRQTIFKLLDLYLENLAEKSVVAVTSKVVALCEGRVVASGSVDKEELIKQESDYYLPTTVGKYGYHFTITQNTLASLAGIDESNGDGNYILWPQDSQKAANQIRAHLKTRFKLTEVGVVITDSTSAVMRWGTIGTALGYSGFNALNSYIGQPDIFGRPIKVSQTGVAIGLAAAAVLAMGEGAEQTPLAVITDAPFVQFVDRDPTRQELELFYVKNKDDDLYAPFLNSIKWQKGQNTK